MKNEIINIDDDEIDELFVDIKDLVEQSRNRVYRTVNTEMVYLCWNIGKKIVEKQEGKKRAEYGNYLLDVI